MVQVCQIECVLPGGYNITSPALVIWGEKDNFVPRSHGETYAKLIQNCSELKISPAAGHSVIVEKPEETAKMVLDFFRTTLVAMTVHRPRS